MKNLLPLAAAGLMLSALPALAIAPSIQLPNLSFPESPSPVVHCMDQAQPTDTCNKG